MTTGLPLRADARRQRRSSPPVAAVKRETRLVHGEALSDDYGWLRAENWKEVLRNPDALPADIQSHLLAENAFAKGLMAPTRALQRAVLKEMRGRIREDDSSVPSGMAHFFTINATVAAASTRWFAAGRLRRRRDAMAASR